MGDTADYEAATGDWPLQGDGNVYNAEFMESGDRSTQQPRHVYSVDEADWALADEADAAEAEPGNNYTVWQQQDDYAASSSFANDYDSQPGTSLGDQPQWSTDRPYGHEEDRTQKQTRRRNKDKRRRRRHGDVYDAYPSHGSDHGTYNTSDVDSQGVYGGHETASTYHFAVGTPASNRPTPVLDDDAMADWPYHVQTESHAQGQNDTVDDDLIDMLAEARPARSRDSAEPAYADRPLAGANLSLPQSYYPVPSQHSSVQSRSSGGAGRRYRLFHSRYFEPGRVFITNWSEPMGEDNGTVVSSVHSQSGVFQKARKFVVLSSWPGHSGCVPILTYGKRGCTKPGTHNEYHGIIYTQGRVPELLPGEDPLGVHPVAMIPDNESEQLDPASRLNYSKVYPVEHNVPVWFIGTIGEADFLRVREAVDRCRMESYASAPTLNYMQ